MRRDPQRGAVTPAVIVGALLLSVVALGVITIGRLGAVRSDAQRAADAGALAALQVIRDRGLPFDAAARAAAETIARKNANLPAQLTFAVTDTPTDIEIAVTATIDVDTPTMVFTGGSRQVQARSTARLPQATYDTAVRHFPKLVLVLDYSGSMVLPFSGGSGRAIDILEQSVASLLAAGLSIDYGAVFFSDNVFKSIPISSAAPDQIVATMNAYDAGGSTNTGAALTTARNLLVAAPDTGRYILLVSDGEPCCASNAFQLARTAGDANFAAGLTTFTLEVRRDGSGAAQDQFLTYVAGTPDQHHDPNHHFVATTAAALVTEFRNIVASIVCKVGPVTPAPTDLATMRVYLRQNGGERSVPASDDLVRDQALERYRWEPSDQTVRLTAAACDAVLDSGANVVIRYDRPTITQ